jgi:hypothetical protein
VITKKEALDKAEDYLLTYIGNLVGPGIPFFDSERNIWIIPVFHMSKIATFPLDEMQIDTNGNIVRAPTRERLIELAGKRFEGNEEIKKFIEKGKL